MATAPFVRLYNAQGPDHVAVVSVQPSWTHEGAAMISVARGPGRHKLGQAALLGPFRAEEAEGRVAEIVAALRAEGFGRPGVPALLEALGSPARKTRALAALRLGWMREPVAGEPLLQAAESAGEETSTLVDALGSLGDPRAIPLARKEAERKLLSRRRSGSEALRALGDTDGLAAARDRALERLPEGVREALATAPSAEPHAEVVARVVDAVGATAVKDRGLALDTLYELGTPLTVAVVRGALAVTDVSQPYVWRYVKSVFKRSLLRHDLATFGWLAHRVERTGRESTGSRATVKSGYDGQTRETRIFGPRTRDYMRRLAWRYLRRLATYRPVLYAMAAAEAVVHYDAKDEGDPKGDFGAYASCYLLNRVLWGRSSRYRLMQGSLRFRLRPGATPIAPEGVREEAFPELWDQMPRAYLRLMGGSRLTVVQEFALKAVLERHRGVLETASHEEVVALLAAPHEPTVQLGLGELQRRFNPRQPDWSLLMALLADERTDVRALGLDWLRQTAGLWPLDPEWCSRILVAIHAEVRDTAAALAAGALRAGPAERRVLVARRILAVLRGGEPFPGAHEGLGAVARDALLAETGDASTLTDLIGWLDSGSGPLKGLAAALLARRVDAVEALGVPRIVMLAKHELVAVRAAALALLGGALEGLADDPSALLEVAESDWPDSRLGAVALLRRLDLTHLGLDAVLEIVDSSHAEVRALGREILTATGRRWDPAVLVPRLLEHPYPDMRPLVLDLAERHLSSEVVDLEASAGFFRSVLMDLRPSRATKRRAVALLVRSGERTLVEARWAVRILGDLIRSRTQQDFEDVLEALTRLHVAFPELELPAELRPAGGA